MTTTTTTTALDGASPARGGPIIETVGLTKTYSGTDFRAVDELNLQVGTGEVFGLLGPERRGQDHHGRGAHDPGDPDRRARPGRGTSTSSNTRPW